MCIKIYLIACDIYRCRSKDRGFSKCNKEKNVRTYKRKKSL